MINSNQISQAVLRHFSHNYNYVMPNIFIGRYEFDVLVLNNQNKYFHEIEVKVSKSDFKRDFKKGHRQLDFENSNGYADRKYLYLSKHDCYENGENGKISSETPNKFWFAVPENLITKEEIPDYAGLFYYSETYPYLRIVKPARFIHKNPAPDLIWKNILDKSYWRYKYNLWELRQARKELNEKNKLEFA